MFLIKRCLEGIKFVSEIKMGVRMYIYIYIFDLKNDTVVFSQKNVEKSSVLIENIPYVFFKLPNWRAVITDSVITSEIGTCKLN